MTADSLLGLPLAEALNRLRAAGIEPRVAISRAPRRTEDTGELRVVRVLEEGRALTACAFVTTLREE